MNIVEISKLLQQVEFESYQFRVMEDSNGRPYLYARYADEDIVTKCIEIQVTRKWMLSEHMTKSEIVQTAFKCCMTSMEHRARESFKYKGRRIFGPHFDVDQLWSITHNGNMDVRVDERVKHENV